MGRISISLDESNSEWVHEQAGDDVEAYVNGLVQKDQQHKAAEVELRRMLDEAEASGISERTAEEIWEEARARYLSRHA